MTLEALIRGFLGSASQKNQFSHTNQHPIVASPSSSRRARLQRDALEESDYPEESLKLISQMLMEEDNLDHKPCILQEYLALQATEKSFSDALGKRDQFSGNQGCCEQSVFRENPICHQEGSIHSVHESSSILQLNSLSSMSPLQVPETTNQDTMCLFLRRNREQAINAMLFKAVPMKDKGTEWRPIKTREKKSRPREEADSAEHASWGQDTDEPLEVYDKVLLCSQMDPSDQHKGAQIRSSTEKKGKIFRGRTRREKKEVVDFTTILTQCAQAVARGDIRSANEILEQIRRTSTPYGDGNERLAHYFANALEARLRGTGSTFYTNLSAIKISTAIILRAYRLYVKCCPFNHMPNLYANKSIVKLAEKATRLHIIDFGTMYGFQWPCLMQQLFHRPGGPPKLRITGVDYPQPGLRPDKRMDKIGSRLAMYSTRFHIPFEFAAITKKWENIKLEDFRFDEGEVLVINCMHRLRSVPDETVVAMNNPRDGILNLMNTINPDMFIHGVINGSYYAPFFLTRFRESLFQFSAAFDMLQTTVPQEEMDRMLFEKEVLGRDIMNIIACEGTQRVERPEGYKQWQIRNMRAGFKQLPLDQEIVKDVTSMVKLHYHKDFVVDKYGNWLLQGWKGRILQALSCWKPMKES